MKIGGVTFLVLILVLMEDTLRVDEGCTARPDRRSVLILVLMEDTLRDHRNGRSRGRFTVLILVLMEDTLRVPIVRCIRNSIGEVLILVLMEDTLRDIGQLGFARNVYSLNPCFNGRYS